MSAFDLEMNQVFEYRSSMSASPGSLNPSWESRYDELLQWRSEKGDTCVPKAEGALGRWVARQRELKRTGKLDPAREQALNSISFVWNTVTAMWEERFRRLNEWRKIHGHCAVPIAQGELGTWVSKQRQLRKRGKLSKEKVDALDSLKFTWSTAEAEWEYKFKRLCEWTKERGHASVPFNEGELGWWVNTQRQTKRKGKLHPSREARLQSLGFVWNPSNSRSQKASNVAMSSASTTPASTPEKPDKAVSQEDTNAILQLFSDVKEDQTFCSQGTKDDETHLPERAKEVSTFFLEKQKEEAIFFGEKAKEESLFLQENRSPVSPEHVPCTEITPPSVSVEHLSSPPLTLLSHSLWSPTILSSPMLISSSLNAPNVPGNFQLQMPLGGSQHSVPFEPTNTVQSHSDALEQLLARDENCVITYIDSLTCHEDL